MPVKIHKGFISLQEIPEDATQLQFHLEVQEGAAPEDFVSLVVKVYNSVRLGREEFLGEPRAYTLLVP